MLFSTSFVMANQRKLVWPSSKTGISENSLWITTFAMQTRDDDG